MGKVFGAIKWFVVVILLSPLIYIVSVFCALIDTIAGSSITDDDKSHNDK